MSGPTVVAVGGGHGLAVTLRACLPWARRLTAVVSVADDGGSSGRLRATTGMPAPGDLRRCLSALAAGDRAVLAAAFEHRFVGGDLDGHAAGNVLLAALAAQRGGDLAAAAREAADVLGVGPQVAVLPASSGAVDLVATTADGDTVRGQVAVEAAGGIVQVRVEPEASTTPAAALDAVGTADLVVLGPGSLYGSVLAAAAVTDLAAALAKTAARRVLVCNLRPRLPETAGYGVAEHVDAVRRHGIGVDVVITHPGSLPLEEVDGVEVIVTDVARPNGLAHDAHLLGEVLHGLVP